MNDLLTTHQVQEILRVDRTTIYRMVEGGRLPAIRVGKQWRFSRPEIERWLQTQSAQTQQSSDGALVKPVADQPQTVLPGQSTVQPQLQSILPLVCVQLIQDAFAEILGVMMVVTDMQGNPVTRLSNPCGFYTALTKDPQAVTHCLRTWQDLAADPSLAPRFASSEMGLLCARGLIRLESSLKGMVVIGGIAPEAWPPTLEQLTQLAATFGQSLNTIQSNAGNVYRMDKANQQRALRSVQRIADIFSHIAGDRNELCGRLQAIAALTIL